jgi:hypothetical protein
LEKETGRERQSRKVGTASVLCGWWTEENK